MKAVKAAAVLMLLPVALVSLYALLWLDDLHELGSDTAQRCRDCGGA